MNARSSAIRRVRRPTAIPSAGGAFAEFERAIIRERVKAGLANARNKGKRLGRPSLAIDPLQVKTLRRTGHSIRQIAGELHVSPASVHKTLALIAS